MRYLENLFYPFLCVLFFSSHSLVFAENKKPGDHDHDHKSFCEKKLTGELEIIPSGRDHHEIRDYQELAHELSKTDGVLQQLGVATPPHQLLFVPSAQLAVLATLGRHAVKHWHDGYEIITGASGAAGVLEFVTGTGCQTCRSFYRDTTDKKDQPSIIFHVAGHNDFAVHSIFSRVRDVDPIKASLELNELIKKYSVEVDPDEVSQWYQNLISLAGLQDMNEGTFTSSEDFAAIEAKIEATERRVSGGMQNGKFSFFDSKEEENKILYEAEKRARAYAKHFNGATPSVLQYLVADLKKKGPQWKYEIAQKYEEMNRVYPYYAQAKITNEGWATFMQILLAAHTKYNTTRDMIDFGQLLKGVAWPGLHNPYWLGLEGWINLHRRFFKEHPELKKRSLMEQDKAFIQYAHSLISWVTDRDFIRLALDEHWINEHNLFLQRDVRGHEFDWMLPRDPQHPEYNQQRVVLTRDPKRVIDFIIKKYVDKSQYRPEVRADLANNHQYKPFSLSHEKYQGKMIPLDKQSMVQMLFILSHSMDGRPVSMDTAETAMVALPPMAMENLKNMVQQNPNKDYMQYMRDMHGNYYNVDIAETFPIKVSLKEQKQIHVEIADPKYKHLEKQLSEQYQAILDEFIEDRSGTYNDDLFSDWKKRFSPKMEVLTKISDHNLQPLMPTLSFDMNSADAVLEFDRMFKYRQKFLRQKIKAGQFQKSKNGIRLKILPLVPDGFHYDFILKTLLEQFEPDEVQDPADGNWGDPFEKMKEQSQHRHKPILSFKTAEEEAKSLRQFPTAIDLSFFQGPTAGREFVQVMERYLKTAQSQVYVFSNVKKANLQVREIFHVLSQLRLSTIDETRLNTRNHSFWLQHPDGTQQQILKALGDSSKTKVEGLHTGIGQGNRRPGDRSWGPGGGEGEGDPGREPGDGSQDPTDVEVPLEEYGKILAEEMELPNIRRTDSESERIQLVQEDWDRKPSGDIQWDKTMPTAMGYGLAKLKVQERALKKDLKLARDTGDAPKVAALQKQLKDLRKQIQNVFRVAQVGLKSLTPPDYITSSTEEEKLPDFEAIVVFKIDMSGSMWGRRQEVAKELVFNISALLKAIYGNKLIRKFVGFDTVGHEMTEDEVFGKFLGGGTRYSGGLSKAKEILDRYPTSRYNKYLIAIGDGETGADDAQESIGMYNELYPECQYIGFYYLTLDGWGWGQDSPDSYTGILKSWASGKEWFRFHEIADDSRATILDAIKALFGKKRATAK